MAWAPDYITLVGFKHFLKLNDTDDDVELAVVISAASRAIDRFTGRQFGKVAASEARTYTARWDRRRWRWVIRIDDLGTAAGLTVATESGTITAYTLEPVNALKRGKVYTHLVVDADSNVQPTGVEHEMTLTTDAWGWPATPDAVVQATYLQANRFNARRKSPFGVAGSPDLGNELRLMNRLDPDVEVSLSDYRRRWGAV
jgi:hypothetical protein